MDFGAQPAFAAPDRLVFAGFFLAPALCWCARTIVLSIMAYSLSASAASISNIFFHMPLFAQCENRVAKTFRQVSPGHAGAITIENCFYKQPIVPGRCADVTLTSRQNILDPLPLIVAKGVTAHSVNSESS
jgi:hypothetical protein